MSNGLNGALPVYIMETEIGGKILSMPVSKEMADLAEALGQLLSVLRTISGTTESEGLDKVLMHSMTICSVYYGNSETQNAEVEKVQKYFHRLLNSIVLLRGICQGLFGVGIDANGNMTGKILGEADSEETRKAAREALNERVVKLGLGDDIASKLGF